MIETLLKIGAQYGVPCAILASIFAGVWFGFWRLAKAVGPQLREWGNELLKHHIAKGNAETDLMRELVNIQHQILARFDTLQASLMLFIEKRAEDDRHITRADLTRTAKTIGDLFQQELELLIARAKGRSDTGDIDPKKEGCG